VSRVTNGHGLRGELKTDDPGELAASGGASSEDPLDVSRVLVTGSKVLATATLRTCARSLKLCGRHSGSLVRLTADATSGSPTAPTSRQVLRDELFELMRELAGVSWHESRRAIDELDRRTRTGTALTERPTRPYRVKP
jgi:hypothetical protein